jgi:drug/metabolite transporter (DMT)-like permease
MIPETWSGRLSVALFVVFAGVLAARRRKGGGRVLTAGAVVTGLVVVSSGVDTAVVHHERTVLGIAALVGAVAGLAFVAVDARRSSPTG